MSFSRSSSERCSATIAVSQCGPAIKIVNATTYHAKTNKRRCEGQANGRALFSSEASMSDSVKVLWHENQRVPVKVWDGGGAVPFEQGVFDQAQRMARMPFVFKHVALMPDAHVGIGCSVGA